MRLKDEGGKVGKFACKLIPAANGDDGYADIRVYVRADSCSHSDRTLVGVGVM
ncbi:hypothetical protein Mapa_009675 [Marchantia paleacea]|nr:hypothetical protein Mapa_009673 [Marchantia paleacea]KAG6548912.1 hypothetical protein Mapa_009675 [Marchantia paleacea]